MSTAAMGALRTCVGKEGGYGGLPLVSDLTVTRIGIKVTAAD